MRYDGERNQVRSKRKQNTRERKTRQHKTKRQQATTKTATNSKAQAGPTARRSDMKAQASGQPDLTNTSRQPLERLVIGNRRQGTKCRLKKVSKGIKQAQKHIAT